ncbi:MAG: hypothetical protein ACQSGP_29470 [Frankia sp.]
MTLRDDPPGFRAASGPPAFDWRDRLRAARHTLPAFAKHQPDRCVLSSNLTGAAEAHTWDRSTGALR